jgi:hypothetical protein
MRSLIRGSLMFPPVLFAADVVDQTEKAPADAEAHG